MSEQEKAILAGGCFWCMVKPFDQWDGVHSVVSGYTGGEVAHPTYEQVKSGQTGHTEAVEITFDPQLISFTEILDIYWGLIDPTDADGQFQDRGSSYRPVIFYTTEAQRQLAEESKQAIQASKRFDGEIVVPIEPAQPFYPAEEYHQDYYRKEPEHYLADYLESGRKEFTEKYAEKK